MPPTTAREQSHTMGHLFGITGIHAFQVGIASLRLTLGFIFLWAFIDKVFGLGFSTARANAWIDGGNPTRGYLASSTGPLAEPFQAIAGHPVTNVLFMGGLLAIGIALIFGIGVRIAGYSGALMMLLMWASHLPPTTNPLVDDHIVYAIAFLLLAPLRAGDYAGLGQIWKETDLVRRYPILG